MLLKTAVALVKNGTVARKANIFIDKGSSFSHIATKFAKELCAKPHGVKTVNINAFEGATSTNNYLVGSVIIVTGEGEIVVDTLIRDITVAPIYRRKWANCLRSTHITTLQLADDFSQDNFPVHILIVMDSVWQFLKPGTVSGYLRAQASSLGYVLSGRLSSLTNGAEAAQKVTQCFASSLQCFASTIMLLIS